VIVFAGKNLPVVAIGAHVFEAMICSAGAIYIPNLLTWIRQA
jgi:hypothetical protein